MVVISLHIYGVKIIQNSGGKVVFLCTNGKVGVPKCSSVVKHNIVHNVGLVDEKC